MLKSLLDQWVDDIIWNVLAFIDAIADELGRIRVRSDFLLQHLACRDVDQAELLSQECGLGISARTWWTQHDHSWRSSWSIALEPETEHFLELISNINLRLILSVMLEDKLIEGLSDTLHVEFILLEALGRQVLQLWSIERLVDANQIVLNPSQGSALLHLEHHKLVRNDADLLQTQCLHLGSWEALDDPALVRLLALLDFLLDQFSDDFVVDCKKITAKQNTYHIERLGRTLAPSCRSRTSS